MLSTSSFVFVLSIAECLIVIVLSLRRLPKPPLFPYTTLFRSRHGQYGTDTAHLLISTADDRLQPCPGLVYLGQGWSRSRSEEHTSELQSRGHLVCRLLLEKKKMRIKHE